MKSKILTFLILVSTALGQSNVKVNPNTKVLTDPIASVFATANKFPLLESDGDLGLGITGATARIHVKGTANIALSSLVRWSSASTTITNANGATNWGNSANKQLATGAVISLGGAIRTVLSLNAAANPQTAVISSAPGNSSPSGGTVGATAYTDGDLFLIENRNGIPLFLVNGSNFTTFGSGLAIGTPHRFGDSSPPIAQTIGPSNVLSSSFDGVKSGGVTVGAGLFDVVGVDTRFVDEVQVGDLISIKGTVREVDTITDQTHLSLTQSHPGAEDPDGYTYFTIPPSNIHIDENGSIIMETAGVAPVIINDAGLAMGGGVTTGETSYFNASFEVLQQTLVLDASNKIVQTWDDAGTIFDALVIDGSGAAHANSTLLNFKNNGFSVGDIKPDGSLTMTGNVTALAFIGDGSGLTGVGSNPFDDSTPIIKGSADDTKLLAIEVDGFTSATTRTITPPNANTSLLISAFNHTISGPTSARTITLPDANFTAARTDAANTFTGQQTFSNDVLVGAGKIKDWGSGQLGLGGAAGQNIYATSQGCFIIGTQQFASGSSFGSADVYWTRDAAASWQMGQDHATAPTAQTIKAHDVTTGTGASLTIAGGKGSVAGGAVIIATSVTNGAPATAVTIDAAQVVNLSKPLRLKNYTVATLPAGTQGDYCYVTDATAPTYGATVAGGGAVVTPVFYDGTNWTCR